MINSDEIQILIDNTDYTTQISEYSESGGEKNYKLIKTMGNTFKKVLQGKSDYQLEPDHNGTQVLVKHDFVF